jgi:glycosyltransferase involved in cell wall biosynthesis
VGRYYKGYAPVNTRVIDPMYGKELGDELRRHDVYLTSAKWEACGMHHIEASCCGLPVVYHKDGGGINEMCESHGVVFEDPSKVCDSILEAFEKRHDLTARIPYEKFRSENVYDEYLKVLRNEDIGDNS